MLFNSVVFLFAFLPITYFVFWNLKTKTERYFWLTLTGYVFYGWWDARFCLLMLFSTLVSYFAGLYILKAKNKILKKRAMVLAISVDLALLGFFKYYNFFADNMHWAVDLPALKIILPVGISFYTFHTMSYIIDAYRGTIKPTKNFFEFSCYVSLFSQLVAGPIVRFRQIEEDLEKIDKSDKFSKINEGFSFFLIGLFKKVLIADSIAAIIDPAFLNINTLSSSGTWLIMLGYTYQLYFDFSGYSDMAVGLGYMFGIRIPQNFNSPYKAIDISDFWRRWHISLSTWLRDYLYIPLGGNRISPLRTKINLFITMLLGGLWHGANWTFIIWGALHGIYLIINHLWKEFGNAKLSPFVAKMITFLLVVIAWVFFRSPDMATSFLILNKMFGQMPGAMPAQWQTLACVVALSIIIAHTMPNTFELKHKYGKIKSWAMAALFLISLVRILANNNSPFLYFQF
ncbi:MAG: MBOAT family protein [Oligoflexia bacterium]|nr:MBOAT family protein [Oligoflexia bacterium]